MHIYINFLLTISSSTYSLVFRTIVTVAYLLYCRQTIALFNETIQPVQSLDCLEQYIMRIGTMRHHNGIRNHFVRVDWDHLANIR